MAERGAEEPAHCDRIHSGLLTSLQARVQLQLALATGMDSSAIQEMFQGAFYENIYKDNWGVAPREL